MAEKQKEKNADTMKVFGLILPSLPFLMLRFGGVFLKFKREAKKGGNVFQKELIDHGLDKTTAEKFTSIYLESSNLRNYMKFFR